MCFYRMPSKGTPKVLAKVVLSPAVLNNNIQYCMDKILGSAGGGDVVIGNAPRYYPYKPKEFKKRLELLIAVVFKTGMQHKLYAYAKDKTFDLDKLNTAISTEDQKTVVAEMYNNIKEREIYNPQRMFSGGSIF